MALKISEEAAVQMPMKTVASLIALVAIGTWAYFGIIETQNKISTTVVLVNALLSVGMSFAPDINAISMGYEPSVSSLVPS